MKKDNHQEMLGRFSNVLVEDILNASDEDIIDEIKNSGQDSKLEADKIRAIVDKAKTIAAKRRLLTARIAIDKEKTSHKKIMILDPLRARLTLEKILKENPHSTKEFTLAARKGKDLSDEDVIGMLEDLQDLGLYSQENEGK